MSVYVIPGSVELMNSIINEEYESANKNESIFQNPLCDVVNAKLKNKNNRYGIDRIGIIIRQEVKDSPNNPFSWSYDENNVPISTFYNPVQTDEENLLNIISRQYSMNSKLFNKTGVAYKIYSNSTRYESIINDIIKV